MSLSKFQLHAYPKSALLLTAGVLTFHVGQGKMWMCRYADVQMLQQANCGGILRM